MLRERQRKGSASRRIVLAGAAFGVGQGKDALPFHPGAMLAGFKAKFPQWPNLNVVPNVVKQVYAENP